MVTPSSVTPAVGADERVGTFTEVADRANFCTEPIDRAMLSADRAESNFAVISV